MFDLSSPLYRAAAAVAARLREAGWQTVFAGGCVRDALLGRPIKDIDIATRAPPEAVESLFPKTVAVGKSFGVIVVITDEAPFEVATFRADGAYADGRRPDAVRFTSAAEDASRRDFTINGLFYDPADGTVSDFVNGRADLAARVIRAIGDPAARFREDHLRLLRAVRFAAVLDFAIEPATAAAIRACAPLLASVSGERTGTELTRILCEAPRPSRALDLLRETGLLDVVLPEVAATHGCPQPPQFHPEGDVWTHTCLMIDALPAPRDADLAWAVLLHDVGKPPTRESRPDPATDGALRHRFPCHAPHGAGVAAEILARLRQPASRVAAVSGAVRRHMAFVDFDAMRPATRRRLIGSPGFDLLLELHRLDLTCSTGDLTTYEHARACRDAFVNEPVLPEPWIRGRDLIARGHRPGPELGRLLERLYDAQLEGAYPDRESLLASAPAP
ncbi:MAG: CCA tRNA nucleotidyltransferase [Lentisphaerae bacterium]|nr:CCA tRNA nucleotidyltransferase [Lentisphaerota bacterium]